MMGKRSDSSTNVIIFIVMILAAMILATWYLSNIRPTRYVIGTVTEDVQELRQHFSNACSFDNYRATYLPATKGGQLIINTTGYCVLTEVFGGCEELFCNIIPTNISLVEDTLMTIQRVEGGPITVTS